jgi:hypothetical protein
MGSTNLGTTPWFASGQVTSDEARYALAAPGTQKAAGGGVAAETGVFPAVNALNVTATSGTNIQVAPGACVVQTSAGGTYMVTVPGATNVAVTAQATNSRIDLVCVRVLDSEAGDGSGQTIQARLLTVEGTAAASPAVPNTPSGYLKIAELTVNSGGITVADRRQYTSAAGGMRLATAQDTRNGAYPGHVRTWGTGQMDVWTGSAWVTVVGAAVWTQVDVPYTFAGFGGNASGTVNFGTGGASFCRYKRTGNDLTISYESRWGTGGFNGGTGPVTTVLPNGWTVPVGRDQWIPCQLWVRQTSLGIFQDFAGLALIQSGSNTVRPYFPWNIGPYSTGIAPWKVAEAPGVAGKSVPYIPNSFAEGGTIHIGPATVELAS